MESFSARSDGFTVLIDHVDCGHLVLLGVGIFHVANRTLGVRHVVGDAFVALGADAGRPFDRRIRADLRFPVCVHL